MAVLPFAVITYWSAVKPVMMEISKSMMAVTISAKSKRASTAMLMVVLPFVAITYKLQAKPVMTAIPSPKLVPTDKPNAKFVLLTALCKPVKPHTVVTM